MRVILWLTALLAALYSGYWVIGSRAVLSETEAALAEMKAEGRADYSSVELHGFPSRFDVTISEPRLTDANRALSWSAPFLQILALSYRPNQVIAVWPNDQTITAGGETFALKSSSLKASITVSPTASLPLSHSETEGHDLSLLSSNGTGIAADKLIFATRLPEGAADAKSHEIALTLTNPALSAALKAAIDPNRRLPDHADQSDLRATVRLDRPLDRNAIEAPARITAIDAIDLKLGWGDLRLAAAGALTAGADGLAEGKLTLTVKNWKVLYDLLRDAGTIPDDQAKMVRNMLTALSLGSGEPDTLKAPLTFADGLVSLGPVPLAPAPRL